MLARRLLGSLALLVACVASATAYGDVCNGGCDGGGGGGRGDSTALALTFGKLSIGNATSGSPGSTHGGSESGAFEGDFCEFNVHRGGKDKKLVSVAFRTKDGTAEHGIDYEKTKGKVSLKPEQRDASIFVQTFTDELIEGDEHFFVLLEEPTKGLIVDGKGKCVIHDNESKGP